MDAVAGVITAAGRLGQFRELLQQQCCTAAQQTYRTMASSVAAAAYCNQSQIGFELTLLLKRMNMASFMRARHVRCVAVSQGAAVAVCQGSNSCWQLHATQNSSCECVA
jgi:hypothetical protein